MADTELKTVYDEISSVFGSDTVSLLEINFKQAITDIQKLLAELNSWTSNTSSKEKELQMKKAYLTIMEFRTMMLGSDSEIEYRIYIRGDAENINEVRIVTIKEKELMKIVGRDRSALRLKQNLDAVVNEQTRDSERQSAFNMHFRNVSSGLEHPSRSKINYVVTQEVIKDFATERKVNKKGEYLAVGLKNLAFQNDTTKGKSAYTLKLFNRGWIYQAFDATTEALSKEVDLMSTNSLKLFREKYFTKYLDYDNVIGFKGGDVGLMQIKSNAASLMSRVTLVKYLNFILNILQTNDIAGSSKSELTKYIENIFTSEENLTPVLDKEIQSNVEKLLKILKT